MSYINSQDIANFKKEKLDDLLRVSIYPQHTGIPFMTRLKEVLKNFIFKWK